MSIAQERETVCVEQYLNEAEPSVPRGLMISQNERGNVGEEISSEPVMWVLMPYQPETGSQWRVK
jgi:hypothetical protein